jgi:hypothetical protein
VTEPAKRIEQRASAGVSDAGRVRKPAPVAPPRAARIAFRRGDHCVSVPGLSSELKTAALFVSHRQAEFARWRQNLEADPKFQPLRFALIIVEWFKMKGFHARKPALKLYGYPYFIARRPNTEEVWLWPLASCDGALDLTWATRTHKRTVEKPREPAKPDNEGEP